MGRAIEDHLVVKVGIQGQAEEAMATEYIRLDIDAVTPEEVGRVVEWAVVAAARRAAAVYAPTLTKSWVEKIRAIRRNARPE